MTETRFVTVDGERRRVDRVTTQPHGYVELTICNENGVPAMGVSVPAAWWNHRAPWRIRTSGHLFAHDGVE